MYANYVHYLNAMMTLLDNSVSHLFYSPMCRTFIMIIVIAINMS